MKDSKAILIECVDHLGIRVRDEKRALEFYKMIGFDVYRRADNDPVIIIRNENGIEINLVINANNPEGDFNILMDSETKFPGLTHLALRVDSITKAIKYLKANGIVITQGPVEFGRDGHISIFIRDPDRNTIELRGRKETNGEIPGLVPYDPNV
ncbi:MAG: VOC family protein [Rhodospirillaceae bacterium]|jgi:lactoylglutathione lyase